MTTTNKPKMQRKWDLPLRNFRLRYFVEYSKVFDNTTVPQPITQEPSSDQLDAMPA